MLEQILVCKMIFSLLKVKVEAFTQVAFQSGNFLYITQMNIKKISLK